MTPLTDTLTPSPVEVGSSTTDLGSPYSVAVSGNYAYVASQWNNSLVVFNVSTPSSPTEVGSNAIDLSWPESVAVSGNYAYVASYGNSSLVVFNSPGLSNGNVDGTAVAGTNHTISFKATSALVSGKHYSVYLQCNSGTPTAGFNNVSGSWITIMDGTTPIYNGSGTVGSCTSGNVSTFSSSSFIPITSGAITSSVNAGDIITISGISATNPNVAATASAPFIIDVQDSNIPHDEGFAALPISSSNQLSYNVVVPPWITLGINITSVSSTDVIGVNTASVHPTLTSSCNAIGGESVYVFDISACSAAADAHWLTSAC